MLLETASATTSRPIWSAVSTVHLWNLDAPCVAVLWQLLLGQAFHLHVSLAASLALGTSVWVIYTADRLLDVARRPREPLTQRHAFHRRHQGAILWAVLPATGIAAAASVFLRPELREAGLVLAAWVLLYLAIVHLLPNSLQLWFPKECAVGIVFSIGCCLSAWTRSAHNHRLLACGVLFAALCSLNCVAIEIWEYKSFPALHPVACGATHWLFRHLRVCLWSVLLASLAGLFFLSARPAFAALSASSILFLYLEARSTQLSTADLRVAADLPLYSPALLLLAHALHLPLSL